METTFDDGAITSDGRGHKDPSIYLPCACTTHVLGVVKDSETNELYVSVFGDYNGEYMRWKDRLRLIWKIIKTGHPYEDQVVLTKDSVNKLHDFLS